MGQVSEPLVTVRGKGSSKLVPVSIGSKIDLYKTSKKVGSDIKSYTDK